jgi:hypothetical protein
MKLKTGRDIETVNKASFSGLGKTGEFDAMVLQSEEGKL